MRRLSVLGLAGVLALSACGSSGDDEATAVCVDKSGVRVPDSECSSSNGGMSDFMWFYLMSSLNQPRYGAQVVHNSYYSNPRTNRYAGFTAPKKVTVARGVPSSGGKVQVSGSGRSGSVKPASKGSSIWKGSGGYNKSPNRPYTPPRPPAPRR